MINDTYTLPRIDFVGGSTESFLFHVYFGKENPKPFGLTGCEANFAIIDYVNKNGTPIISKTMTVEMDYQDEFYNILSVQLNSADTVDLCGKFIYQVTIRDVEDMVDIPQQGVIYIHNNINKDYLKQNS